MLAEEADKLRRDSGPSGCRPPGTADGRALACDLGLTDVRPGDETFSMVTALISAGSATVVASVARVADTAMATMTGYHRAITAGTSPAAALAAALDRETSAGFVCFGAG